MPQSRWQNRAARAQQLRQELRASAEILAFYESILVFQERLHSELASSANNHGAADWPPASPTLYRRALASFQDFLSLVRKTGPSAVSAVAATLESQGPESWRTVLDHQWATTHPPQADSPIPFLCLTFLQPYAEARAQVHSRVSPVPGPSLCPACGRRPGFAVLRPQGDGGKRSLVCSFCLAEWEFRRVVCAGCGEEDHRKLPVFLAEAPLDHVRLECCDACKQYLKAIDLTRNGLAEPVVDELAAVALDLWARERGYAKIALNLMGL